MVGREGDRLAGGSWRLGQTSGDSLRSAFRRPGGFTQIEIAIAVVVLAVGILGVFASFAFAIQSTRFSGRMTQAVTWNRQVLELIRVRNLPFTVPLPPPEESGLNDPPNQPFEKLPDLNAAPFLNDLPLGTGFKRSIQVRRLSNNVADYRYTVAEITVTIFWMENGRPRNVSMKALHRQP